MPHLSQVAAVLLALAPPIGPCSRRQPCFFCRIHSVRGLCNSTVGGGVDESQPPPVDQGRQNPPKIDNPSTASSQDQAPTPAASPPAGVPTSPILPPAKEPTGPLSMLSPLTGVGTQPWVPSTFTITFDTNHVMLLRRTHRPSTGGGGGEKKRIKKKAPDITRPCCGQGGIRTRGTFVQRFSRPSLSAAQTPVHQPDLPGTSTMIRHPETRHSAGASFDPAG